MHQLSEMGLSTAVAAMVLGIGVGAALAQGGGQTIRVGMVGSTYAPAVIEARVGDTLRFVNDDVDDHTVFVPTRGFGIDFGVMKPGGEATMALGRAGRFRVECVNHSRMLLAVEVKP